MQAHTMAHDKAAADLIVPVMTVHTANARRDMASTVAEGASLPSGVMTTSTPLPALARATSHGTGARGCLEQFSGQCRT
jgi:hypothetical protein